MLNRFDQRLLRWTISSEPWTNVYGLARTLLALGTLGTLALSHSNAIFVPTLGDSVFPNCTLGGWTLFCLAPKEHLETLRWVAVLLLALVASGWRPRLTGLVHWWVSYSVFANVTLTDGGDQVTAVLTLLLLPICLTDSRTSHWHKPIQVGQAERKGYFSRLVAHSTFLVIRLQVALVYFHAAQGKLNVPEWINGTAVYYWFIDPTIGMPHGLAGIMMPVLQHPIGVSFITWGTVLLELALAACLIADERRRRQLLLLGVLFHFGIIVFHGLPSFALAMWAALLLFLYPYGNVLAFRIPSFLVFSKTRQQFSTEAHAAD